MMDLAKNGSQGEVAGPFSLTVTREIDSITYNSISGELKLRLCSIARANLANDGRNRSFRWPENRSLVELSKQRP